MNNSSYAYQYNSSNNSLIESYYRFLLSKQLQADENSLQQFAQTMSLSSEQIKAKMRIEFKDTNNRYIKNLKRKNISDEFIKLASISTREVTIKNLIAFIKQEELNHDRQELRKVNAALAFQNNIIPSSAGGKTGGISKYSAAAATHYSAQEKESLIQKGYHFLDTDSGEFPYENDQIIKNLKVESFNNQVRDVKPNVGAISEYRPTYYSSVFGTMDIANESNNQLVSRGMVDSSGKNLEVVVKRSGSKTYFEVANSWGLIPKGALIEGNFHKAVAGRPGYGEPINNFNVLYPIKDQPGNYIKIGEIKKNPDSGYNLEANELQFVVNPVDVKKELNRRDEDFKS
jgi:hypothetical protein